MSRKRVSIAASASERGAERSGARRARGGLALNVNQYGDIVAEQGKLALAGVKTSVLAAVGAGDLIVARATEQAKYFTELASGQISLTGYLQTAGGQAANAYAELSKRGAEVVHEFRKDPRVQRVILRAERTVDVVEDGLEDLLEEVGSDAEQVADAAKASVAEGAERTRASVRKTAARNTNARKSTATTPPVRKAPARKAAARTATPRTTTPRTTTPRTTTPRTTTPRTTTPRKASTRQASTTS